MDARVARLSSSLELIYWTGLISLCPTCFHVGSFYLSQYQAWSLIWRVIYWVTVGFIVLQVTSFCPQQVWKQQQHNKGVQSDAGCNRKGIKETLKSGCFAEWECSVLLTCSSVPFQVDENWLLAPACWWTSALFGIMFFTVSLFTAKLIVWKPENNILSQLIRCCQQSELNSNQQMWFWRNPRPNEWFSCCSSAEINWHAAPEFISWVRTGGAKHMGCYFQRYETTVCN